MFVRRHRLTIEIEQQTLRIHQRTASITVDSDAPETINHESRNHPSSDPETSDRESSNLTQSHHTSAFAIVPEAKPLALDPGRQGKLRPDSSVSHPPVIITITSSATGDSLVPPELLAPEILAPSLQASDPSETAISNPAPAAPQAPGNTP